MYVLQVQGKPKVIPIKDASEFADLNLPGFSYLAKKEIDLQVVPLSALVAIFNAANPDAKVVKFPDHATANRRVWPCVVALAGGAAKPAAQPLRAAPTGSPRAKIGVAATLFELGAAGVSIKELSVVLEQRFPERKLVGMVGTCRQCLSSGIVTERFAPGMRWHKSTDDKARGLVYTLVKA